MVSSCIVFGLALAIHAAPSIVAQPARAFVSDVLTQQIGRQFTVRDSTQWEPSPFAIAVTFPVQRDANDVADEPARYSIDWTQPDGTNGLPSNTIWNGHNIGDLYWLPCEVHLGIHRVVVSAAIGTESISKTFTFNIVRPTFGAGPYPTVPPANAELKGYLWKLNNNAQIIGTQRFEPLATNGVYYYPATHCCWLGEPAGSGGSINPTPDNGIYSIGPFGTPRTVAITQSGSHSVAAYSRMVRSNALNAWNSQTPSHSNGGALPAYTRFQSDVSNIVGAEEGRYPGGGAVFRSAFPQFWLRCNETTRRRLLATGQFVPTFQAALRSAMNGQTNGYPADLVCHPIAFPNGAVFDPAKLNAYADALNVANYSPPITTVAVLSETFAANEHVITGERNVSRTWVGLERDRQIRLDARQSFTPGGAVKKVHWFVLNGNAEITAINDRQTVVDVLVRFANQPTRIGIFAEADDDGRDERLRFSAPAFAVFSPWSSLMECRGQDHDTNVAADGQYIRLVGYNGYNPYDKRQYREYAVDGRLLRVSCGGRGEIWRQWAGTMTTNPGSHKEDIFSYDAAGNMIGFRRLYANSFGTFGFDHRPNGLRITGANKADVMTARYTVVPRASIEQSSATYEYAGSDIVKIEHVRWVPDPLYPTDRRRDVRTVTGYETITGGNVAFHSSVGAYQAAGQIVAGAVVSGALSVPYNGRDETLAEVLARLRLQLGI